MVEHAILPTENDLLCLECLLPDCNDRHPECHLYMIRIDKNKYNRKPYEKKRDGYNI